MVSSSDHIADMQDELAHGDDGPHDRIAASAAPIDATAQPLRPILVALGLISLLLLSWAALQAA